MLGWLLDLWCSTFHGAYVVRTLGDDALFCRKCGRKWGLDGSRRFS